MLNYRIWWTVIVAVLLMGDFTAIVKHEKLMEVNLSGRPIHPKRCKRRNVVSLPNVVYLLIRPNDVTIPC